MSQILFAFFILMSNLVWADALRHSEIHYFRPFVAGQQKPNYVIKRTVHGRCVAQSSVILREDAWHCTTSDESLDPCFAKSENAGELLCFLSPKAKEAVLLTLDQPLAAIPLLPLDVSKTHPWLIKLEQGLTCQFESQDSYRCEDKTLLLPPLQRCGQPWHILHQKGTELRRLAISEVWF